MIHQYQFRVYYVDTDASGILYHANYLSYAERARSEWFHENGLPITALLERGDAFVVCHADVEYKRPAPLNSLVRIETVVKEVKAATCTSEQCFYSDDTLLAIVRIEAVSVDAKTLKPKRIPTDIRALYNKYIEQGE